MNKINQELEEQFYIDEFLKLLDFPVTKIKRGSNPPDFILTLNDSRIAVEITEFYSQNENSMTYPRRQVEAEWSKFRKEITEKKQERIALLTTHCFLTFKTLLLPSKKEKEGFIDELFLFVNDYSNNLSQEWFLISPPFKKYCLLEKYLKAIRLRKSRFDTTWECSNVMAASVGLSEAGLIQCIQDKINCTQFAGVDKSWLLIVSGTELSQNMGIPAVENLTAYKILNSTIEKSFYEGIFIYQFMLKRILKWSRVSSGGIIEFWGTIKRSGKFRRHNT